MRRSLAAGLILALISCSEQPTQQSPAGSQPRISAVTASSVPACSPSAFPPVGVDDGFNLYKRFNCGQIIGISAVNVPATQLAQVQAAITAAAANWNAALQEDPTLNLPKFAANQGGGILVDFHSGGGGAINCGNTPAPLQPGGVITINILYACNGNYVPWNHLSDLITHELGHALGFDSTPYHKLPVGVNDHCVMSLPPTPNSGTINSLPCQFELEKFYQIYGVRPTVPDNFRHNITGLQFSQTPPTLITGQTSAVSVSALMADRANASICGGGGSASMPSEGRRLTIQCSGTLPAIDATYGWTSSNTTVASVAPAAPGSANATLTAGAAGSTVITVQVTNPGIHQLAARFGLYAGESNQFTVTVQAAVPTAISIVQGNSQTAQVGTTLLVAPTVKVTDQLGRPVAGVSITFLVTSGGGSVSPLNVTTGATGTAAGSWTLGTGAGAQSLRASATPAGISGNPLTFTATGVAGPATSMSKFAGDNQTWLTSTTLPVKPSVKVTDAFGNPTSGRTVTFTIASGGGTIIPASVVTTASGLATVTKWILGPAAGNNALTAASAGLSPATLTFTAQGVLVVPPTAFLETGCTTSVVAGKTYANYTSTWTPAGINPAGTTSEIGESFTGVASTAVVIWPGLPGTTQNLGPYLTGPTGSSPRYLWVRSRNGTNVSTWAPLDLFPITFVNGCQA